MYLPSSSNNPVNTADQSHLGFSVFVDKKLSLEEEFEKEAFPDDVDVMYDCGFEDYLEPNEGTPEGIEPYLKDLAAGIHVITGTERVFFATLFSADNCKGVVGRDINHRVKAYNDFNILLLKISNSAEEYSRLSEIEAGDGKIEEKVAEITRIATAKLENNKAKKYYLSNITAFSKIYYSPYKSWKTYNARSFANCQYHLTEPLFQKLHRYAVSGNIISTIGSINDLLFLSNRHVSVVDTSNIADYCWIDLQGGANFTPRIIITRQNPFKTTFHSLEYPIVSAQERQRLNYLTSVIMGAVLKNSL